MQGLLIPSIARVISNNADQLALARYMIPNKAHVTTGFVVSGR